MLAVPVLLLAALSLPPGARPASATGFPAASTGDIWFQVDHAGFRDEDGRTIEEYYLRVPNDQFEFEETLEAGVPVYLGRAFVSLTFQDAEGNRLGEATGRFDFRVGDPAAARTRDRVQLFVMREMLDPRAARLQVRVEDLNARKRGLLYLVTGKRKSGQAQGTLEPPACLGGGLTLSDIQFVWVVEPLSPGSRFGKNNLNVVPNPGRAYGLYRDTLQVYFEVYDPDPPPAGAFFVSQELRDSRGVLLASRADTVQTPGTRWVCAPRFPVRDLEAGTYDLAVRIDEFGTARTAASRRPFNVVWSEGSWARTEEDVRAEARVALNETDYERFREMQAGDRESYLATFWAAHDPTPNTARNELRALFQERVEIANRNFSTPFERGLASDRGRIYIRYGPPDDITREVMPQIGSTLNEVLDAAASDRPDLQRLRSSNANAVVDTRPYEIWSYTRQGEPLFPDRETMTSSTGLTFIFVDDQGIGNYVLRYSSSFIRY